MKDLLRSLLQQEPENRIDWEDFFNHPVFIKNGLISKGNTEVMSDLVDTKNLDQEFNKNKEQMKALEKHGPCIPPEEMKIEKSAEQIIENSTATSFSMDGSPSDKKVAFREYAFRYYHEKNKILMIYLTIKKLRQLMKEKEFAEYHKQIYLLINLLAKKGSILSELTLMSLKMKNNIFKLPFFEEFCNTSDYTDVIKTIADDQKSIFEYKDYISGLWKDVSLTEEDKKLLQVISKGYVDLKYLDEQAKQIFGQVRGFDSTASGMKNEQLRHFYYLTMIFTVYSIRSELYMPYMVENHKFEWDTFREKHENISSQNLWNLLSNIPTDF